MKLEKTNNYDLFVTNSEQRPISQQHAKKLASSIQQFGFLPSKPIQCYRKGGRLVVVDGHHRLEAARATGAHLYFIVEGEESQRTMGPENILVKKWSGLDFARMYAARGSKDYQELIRYNDRGIPLNMAASMLINNGAASGNANAAIIEGTFKIKCRRQAEAVCSMIETFGGKNEAVHSRAFISAYSKCLMWDGFSNEAFTKRMRENLIMLEKTSNAEQMLTVIEGIYNKRSRSPVALKFHVEEAARKRNLNGLMFRD
jgi:hypothetical protein